MAEPIDYNEILRERHKRMAACEQAFADSNIPTSAITPGLVGEMVAAIANGKAALDTAIMATVRPNDDGLQIKAATTVSAFRRQATALLARIRPQETDQ